MRGRRPAGPEYVTKLEGSAASKERLRVILETVAGRLRLQEACELLGISEQRFHQLREAALQAALSGVEPRPAGRPSAASSPGAAQIRALEEALVEKDLALHEAQVREEVALILPQVRTDEAGPEKKRTGPEREQPWRLRPR